MLTISSNKGNANQNHTKIPPNPYRIAIIKNTTNKRCWQGCREKGNFIHCWWECKLVQQLWKKIWSLLKNLNIDQPCDPAIPLLGMYPKEWNTGYSRGTCTPMFIAALFTIAKLWKQPRYPTTDEWIKKMCTQWNSTQLRREMKSYHLQVNGWSWRTSFWARSARLRRPKIVCSPSYADLRSRAKAAMWLDLDHKTRGEHIQEI
jgi:hypothetical protein